MDRKTAPLFDLTFLFLLVALTFALHRAALGVFFGQDDLLFLQRVEGLAVWTHGIRRFLSVRCFFTACWELFGPRADLFHVVILSLHGVNGFLTAIAGRKLGLSRLGGAVAGLCFVAAPAAFTCLHWISGVQEVLFAFFALLTTLCVLQGSVRFDVLGLLCFVATLLCKEAGFLLMPALALLLPMSRQRRLLLAGLGLALGLVILVGAGALETRPHGDPYETAYGVNLFWNLLTYLAWLARPWDYFADRVPEFQPSLWRWGLIIPAIFGFLAWRRHDWRPVLIRAALFFLLLLLPVLPLLRHSYLYYLYVPLIPVWLLLAAGAERLPASWRLGALALPLGLFLLSAWQGEARRDERLSGKLQSDSILRYAQLVETAVEDLRGLDNPKQGDMLILSPFLGEAIDLAKGVRAPAEARRVRFLPVAKALHGGVDLRLFFPELTSVRFVPDFGAGDEFEWEDRELYWTFGQGRMAYLGRGIGGRFQLSRLFFQQKDWPRARREIEFLLSRYPDDPDRLYDLGALALAEGEAEEALQVLTRLTELAAAEAEPGRAARALADFRQIMTRGQPEVGTP